MKTLAALLLALCSFGYAASWDGTKGDITITTLTRSVRVGNFDESVMTVKVTCANPAVSAVRVEITTHAGSFTGKSSQLVQITPRGTGVAIFRNTSEEFVTGAPKVTVLFDGATAQF